VSKVSFNYADRKLPLKHKRKVQNFIPNIFSLEGKKLHHLKYVFCSDEYLLQINKKFLHHNTYTDIITFNLSESNNLITGEIYISCDRVKENALKYQEELSKEFLRVIFHGVLHLCEYKDKKDVDIKIMRQKEDFYIQLFHVKHKDILNLN
jgi:rRNA maturation RNase YbeY